VQSSTRDAPGACARALGTRRVTGISDFTRARAREDVRGPRSRAVAPCAARVPRHAAEIEVNDIQEWALVTSKRHGLTVAIKHVIPEGAVLSAAEMKRIIAAGEEFARFTLEEDHGSDWRFDYEQKTGLTGTTHRLSSVMVDCGSSGVAPRLHHVAVAICKSIRHG
jgi:hypothetical protein